VTVSNSSYKKGCLKPEDDKLLLFSLKACKRIGQKTAPPPPQYLDLGQRNTTESLTTDTCNYRNKPASMGLAGR